MPDAPILQSLAVHALVVDDDAFVRGVVVRQLAALGVAEALSAGDWSAARAVLERTPTCNVVISDLDMPGAAGSAFLDELAALRPGIALIIISATDRLVLQAAEKHARKLPLRVLGSVAKPTSVDALRALLVNFDGQ